MQVFDTSSDLYKYDPDFVILFYSSIKLLKKFYAQDNNRKAAFAEDFLNKCSSITSTLASSLRARIIFFNVHELNDSIFGNYANKTNLSFLFQARKINLGLMTMAQRVSDLFILDLNVPQSRYGYSFSFDPKIYINTDAVFSLDFLPVIARILLISSDQ